MMHGPNNREWALRSEARKAGNVSGTLGRFWHYFKPFWPILVAVAFLVTCSTYVQVWTPDLLGQAVDCYLTPATAQALSGTSLPVEIPTGNSATAAAPNCLFGYPGANATTADYIGGLTKLVLLLIALYASGSVLTGLQFYLMNTTGFGCSAICASRSFIISMSSRSAISQSMKPAM